MRWSVGIEAEGDRVFTREEIVELADAVAASSGVAAGIGTNRYGAQLLVTADSREDAIDTATGPLLAKIPVGVQPHGLCVWPQPGRYSLGHTGITR